MQFITKYIAIGLLAIFTMPQVNNALHYFVIKHSFLAKVITQTDVHIQGDHHHCEQFIFIQAATLLAPIFEFTSLQIIPCFFKHFYKHNNFISHLLVYNYTRGPPALV